MPETTEAGGLIDTERFRAVADDCDWTLTELSRFFISGTREQLDELRAVLAAGDAREVERLAHSCVGSAATCGIDGLVELFRRLERAAGAGEPAAGGEMMAQIDRRMKAVEGALSRLTAE